MSKKSIAFIGTEKTASALVGCIYDKNFVRSIITNGRKEGVLLKIVNRSDTGTVFYSR